MSQEEALPKMPTLDRQPAFLYEDDPTKENQDSASDQAKTSDFEVAPQSNNQHLNSSNVDFSSESDAKETEAKLLEATVRLKMRDNELKTLREKLMSLETKVELYEIKKAELEEALLKIKRLEEIVRESQVKAKKMENENEGLANTNFKLTQDLASYESKLTELKKTHNSVLSEREELLGQLTVSKQIAEELNKQVSAEGEKIQSQISSVLEENNSLLEVHQSAKNELQAEISRLEEQLKEKVAKESFLKGHIENLESELVVKSAMQARIAELEEELVIVDKQFKDEKVAGSKKELETQVSMKQSADEIETKQRQVQYLERQVVEFQKNLMLLDAQYKEKMDAVVDQSYGRAEEEHHYVAGLEYKVKQLEDKLETTEDYYKERGVEEHKQLELAVLEIDELRSKLYCIGTLQNRIAELENELQMANTKKVNEGAEENTKTRDFSPDLTDKSNVNIDKVANDHNQNSATGMSVKTAAKPVGLPIKFVVAFAIVSLLVGLAMKMC